jgi:hypothetical protein
MRPDHSGRCDPQHQEYDMDDPRTTKRLDNPYAKHRDALATIARRAQDRLEEVQDRIQQTSLLLAESRRLLAGSRGDGEERQPPSRVT